MTTAATSSTSNITSALNNQFNENFKCGVCSGFIIDATTISDCLHSFCKSCIVLYFETNPFNCPACNTCITDTDNLNCIQADPLLQRLIYKCVPGLLKDEVDRRERFYYENKGKTVNVDKMLTSNSLISVKIDLSSSRQKRVLADANGSSNEESSKLTRYLQCNADTPIRVLTKLLRNKYEIPKRYDIKFRYMDQELHECETVLEVLVSFICNKDDLLELKYDILPATHSLQKDEPEKKKAKIDDQIIEHAKTVAAQKPEIEPKIKEINKDFLKVRLKKPKVSIDDKSSKELKHNNLLKCINSIEKSLQTKTDFNNNTMPQSSAKNDNSTEDESVSRKRGRPSSTSNRPVFTVTPYRAEDKFVKIAAKQPTTPLIGVVSPTTTSTVSTVTNSLHVNPEAPLDLSFKK